MIEKEARKVYLVIYSNYWPYEVESVWSTREGALERADQLGGAWKVMGMKVDEPGEGWMDREGEV